MTKLAPEWVRTSDPVIRSPARYGGPERTWCKYILFRYSDLASRYSDLLNRYSDLSKSL